MALTFVGFAQGEAITTLDWSLLADGLGGDYDYHGDGFKPQVGLGVREVTIGVGRTTGWGVQAVLDAAFSVALPAPASGDRSYMIVVERNWVNGQGTIKALDCGSASRIPPSSLRYRGDGDQVDHQPICYATVRANVTSVVALVDLRVMAEKVRAVASEEAIITTRARVGQLYMLPDGRLLKADPGQSGSVVLNPQQKRVLTFHENGISSTRFGVNGELTIPWPVALDWDPIITSCHVWSSGITGNQAHCYADFTRQPNRREGRFIVRAAATNSPIRSYVSRITVTLMEA